MKNINWGIIGCGDVTEVKSGPAFKKVNNSRLHAVMRRNSEKAEDYANRHGVPTWYSNAESLIKDKDVNAVYIATPPSSHAMYAKMAIQAGKPVYIEKPMCTTYTECLEVLELAAEKGVAVHVAYYRRCMPLFRKVKALLDSGILGAIRMVDIKLFKHFDKTDETPWRVNPDIAGGGHFYDLASHQIDLLHFYFGEINEVVSIVDNLSGSYSVEDTLSVSMRLNDSIIFNGSWCFAAGEINNQDKFIIYGTNGRIEFSTFDMSPIFLYTKQGTEKFEIASPEHVQQPLIENVTESLLKNVKSESTGASGAKTNYILEKVVESFYK